MIYFGICLFLALAFYCGFRFYRRISDPDVLASHILFRDILLKSEDSTVIVYLLRHGGCIFCYEGLYEFKKFISSLISKPFTYIVLLDEIHRREVIEDMSKINPNNFEVIVDCGLYKAFGLPRGSFMQLFSPKVFLSGIRAFIKFPKYRLAKPKSDGFQLGGFFIIKERKIVSTFIGSHAGDIQFFVE